MIQLQLHSIKEFMNQLLCLDYFDNFSCVSGEITTFNTFTIDGFIHKEYYDHQGEEHLDSPFDSPTYSTWLDLKKLSYSLIKGSKLPLRFKFVFKLPNQDIDSFIRRYALECNKEEIQGLYFNIRYENQYLYATTGITLKTFSLSKDIEKAWDTEFIAIMNHLKLDYQVQ